MIGLKHSEMALIKKDFNEIWHVKMVRTTLIVVPLCMVLFLPLLFLFVVALVPIEELNGIDQMLRMLPSNYTGFTDQQGLFYMATNVVSPMFFLLVPLMSATVSAACSFVGEKERGTMETLLLTPMSVRSIFKAKVLSCMLLSAMTTLVSFVLFAAVASVGDITLKIPFFFNWNWFILLFLLAPALTALGVEFMVLVSGKSKSYMESVQISGYLVVPLILLFVGQFTGLFQINAVLLLIVALVILVADVVLYLIAARRFTAERLLRR